MALHLPINHSGSSKYNTGKAVSTTTIPCIVVKTEGSITFPSLYTKYVKSVGLGFNPINPEDRNVSGGY